MDHERTLRNVRSMSALPLEADIVEIEEHVCLVPIGDVVVGAWMHH
jgi:hypothetical protein